MCSTSSAAKATAPLRLTKAYTLPLKKSAAIRSMGCDIDLNCIPNIIHHFKYYVYFLLPFQCWTEKERRRRWFFPPVLLLQSIAYTYICILALFVCPSSLCVFSGIIFPALQSHTSSSSVLFLCTFPIFQYLFVRFGCLFY